MITVTKAAADQIRKSATDGNMEGLALRLAATSKPDGSLDYGMGFDDIAQDDVAVEAEGVKIIIGPQHVGLLKGATMDYVEMEPGVFRFIFLNPNDANYSPPTED